MAEASFVPPRSRAMAAARVGAHVSERGLGRGMGMRKSVESLSRDTRAEQRRAERTVLTVRIHQSSWEFLIQGRPISLSMPGLSPFPSTLPRARPATRGSQPSKGPG